MSSFYPGYIKNGPYIKGEVSYREYKKVSDFLKNKCWGKKIYAPIHNPDRYYFYDIKVDRHSYIDSKMLTKDRRFYKDDQGVYRIVHENIPTMTSKESVYDYLNNNSSCILVEKSWLERYLWLELFDYINKNYYSKKIGITDVYYQ